MKQIAGIISYIFHPLWMPIIGCFLIFHSGHYLQQLLQPEIKQSIYLIMFVGTAIIPLLVIPILYFQGLISSFQLAKRRERPLVIGLVIILYLLSLYLVFRFRFPSIIVLFFAGIIAGLIISFITHFFIKPSLHMSGIGAICGLIIALTLTHYLNLFVFLVIGFLVAGIIGSSRLLIKAHSQVEIYLGFFIGLVPVLGLIIFLS